MTQTDTTAQMSLRATMAAIGLLAGLALWALHDWVVDLDNLSHGQIVLLAFAWGFTTVWLLLTGPLTAKTAGLIALCQAGIAALLLGAALLRYDSGDLSTTAAPSFAALWVLLLIPLPFILAWQRENTRLDNYEVLFFESWAGFVRILASVFFVGVTWILILLSNTVLGLVGLTIIEDFLEFDPVPWAITGTATGLALAVAYEFRAFISPFLLQRLLRLFVPVIFAVAALFLVGLAVRGLGFLPDQFSTATILMGFSAVIASVITVSVDTNEDGAVQGLVMQTLVRALCAALLIFTLLSLWAVWTRVATYGWTPQRVWAALFAALSLGYGLLYGAAALRSSWQASIRRANIYKAGALVALFALVLTPVINPERISAKSQLARWTAGEVELDDLALWEMQNEWGKAGVTAIQSLKTSSDAALLERIALAEDHSSKYAFRSALREEKETMEGPSQIQQIEEALVVLPEGAALPDGVLELIRPRERRALAKACTLSQTSTEPTVNCLAIVEAFDANSPRVFFAWRQSADAKALWIVTKDGVARSHIQTILQLDSFNALAQGNYSLEPLELQGLRVGDRLITPF
ncbi:MAG: DUF4153 domain-containing protein [Pseudomonadota bacterium]